MSNWISSLLKREIIKIPVRPRRKPSIGERRIFNGICILFLLLLACFVVWRVQLYCEINRRLSAIRDAGLPTSGQELNNWRLQVPEAENAALVLTQAFALLRTFPIDRANGISESTLLDRSRQWSDDTRKLVAEYIATNAEALGIAREAVQRSHCRYAANLSYGPYADLSHLDKLKRLARVIALRAVVEAEERRGDSWAEDVGLELQLAKTLDEEPVLISYLVRNSILRLAAQSTECGLNLFSPDGPACEKIGKLFADVANTNLLPTALIGERAMLIPAFRLSWAEIQHLGKTDEDGLGAKEKPQPLSGKPATILWLSGGFERDLNFFLQVTETNIAFAELSPPASLAFTNVSEQLSDVARKRYYILSALLLPAYANVVIRDATADARTRLAIAALAIERFRLAREHLPENLNELVPQFLSAVPVDPFDGQPLRYHRLTKGYVIYSVGRDGHDNGGHERPSDAKSSDKTEYDITFIVEQ